MNKTNLFSTSNLTDLQDFMFDTMLPADDCVDWFCDRHDVNATDEVIDFVVDAHFASTVNEHFESLSKLTIIQSPNMKPFPYQQVNAIEHEMCDLRDEVSKLRIQLRRTKLP